MAKRITKRITKSMKSMKRSKSIKSRSKKSRRSKRSRLYKGGMSVRGAPPASYVGSIQGEFINSNGQQLFRNPVGPVGGIA